MADPLSREGWTGGTEPKQAATTLATIDFGEGGSGLYDFTDNQWFNPLRSNRIVVRGSQGELVDDRVVRLADPVTAVESHLVRRQTGIDLNLEGFDLDHISFDGRIMYRNPYQGARLAEDDGSVATAVERMGAWCRGEVWAVPTIGRPGWTCARRLRPGTRARPGSGRGKYSGRA